MRLLNVITLELEEFFGENIPPYAILSHKWQEGEEVSYADLGTSDKAPLKAGWRKIRYTCEQAKKEGKQYVWIDTCCIDKSSSAELSEAINSMYSWYSDARVCYVYMSDVSKEDIDATFTTSRWFTRGWTLQELLAPKSVIFYDKEWECLGGKRDGRLARLIIDITKIDRDVLEHPEMIRKQSVACRMSWASNRTTTRPEDVSYSLMGIFGVNMPLLYGEGDRAFDRLQDEIVKVDADHSLLAWDLPQQTSASTKYIRLLKTGGADLWPGFQVEISPFAKSPRDFEHSKDIIRGNSLYQGPYMTTNKGLQIDFPVVRIGSKIYGLLNCHRREFGNSFMTIQLKDSIPAGLGYSRVFFRDTDTGVLRLEDVIHSKIESTLLIRDNTRQSWYNTQTQSSILLRQTDALKSLFLNLQSVFPPERRLNPNQQIFQLCWLEWCTICYRHGPGNCPEHCLAFILCPSYPLGKIIICLERLSASCFYVRFFGSDNKLRVPAPDDWNGSRDQWLEWATQMNSFNPQLHLLDEQSPVRMSLSGMIEGKDLLIVLARRFIYSISYYELLLDIVDS